MIIITVGYLELGIYSNPLEYLLIASSTDFESIGSSVYFID